MIASRLDSRASLGTDVQRASFQDFGHVDRTHGYASLFIRREVRVVVGRLGSTVRLSAGELGVIVDGNSLDRTWQTFLEAMQSRPDACWLAFDIGPTRADEITAGLDSPDDEDWAGPADED